MNIFDFTPPTDPIAVAHGAELYARRDTATHVPFREVAIGDWSPELQGCHDNVFKWVEHHPSHAAVHGWLYMGDNLHHVRFVSHSIVRGEGGELFDITPMGATSANYPFLESNLNEDAYADIINHLYEKLGAGFLHHHPWPSL
jgi:hypothetical protein